MKYKSQMNQEYLLQNYRNVTEFSVTIINKNLIAIKQQTPKSIGMYTIIKNLSVPFQISIPTKKWI